MRRRQSEATKKKISRAQKGTKNSMYGKKHKRTTLKKMSVNNSGKKNPMYGKKHSAATKKKISLAVKRAFRAKQKKRK